MAKFVDRVAEQAATVKPLRLLLSIPAAVFYVVGWLLGLVVVLVLWAVSSVQLGIADAKAFGRRDGAKPAGGG